jgi:arylformamidase
MRFAAAESTASAWRLTGNVYIQLSLWRFPQDAGHLPLIGTFMDPRLIFDLDEQPPLPFEAAEKYAATVLEWSSVPPEVATMQRDISYGPDRRQRYDLFTPPGVAHAPILVFFHGGGWTNGYKEFTGFMADHVARLGLALVAPSYRLAPAHRFPAPFDDCLAVLADVTKRAAEFGIDASRIYLSGHSAGGHLATLTALRRADRARAGLDADAIRGCLPISGIMDMHHPQPAPGSLEERVYTTVLNKVTDDAVMSPIAWAAGNTIPMVLSHGDRDSARVMSSNARLEAVLALQPGGVARFVEPNEDHFQTHLGLRDANHPWYARLKAMVAGHTAGR